MRSCSRASGGAPGFTLIELMLAVGVLALILAMLAGSFDAVARSKTNAEGNLYAERAGRAIIARLANELRGAVQTLPVESRVLLIGSGRMESGLPLDNLTLATLNPGRRRSITNFGAEEVVTYTTVPNPARRGWFVLQRSQMSALVAAGGGLGPSEPVVLAENVVSLHLRYFDGAGWHESWNSSQAEPGAQLPRAISIDLKMAAGQGRVLQFSTFVGVPMSSEEW